MCYIECFEVHLISTPVNETPTPLEMVGVGKFPHSIASDVEKPSPWLEMAIFGSAEWLSSDITYSPSVDRKMKSWKIWTNERNMMCVGNKLKWSAKKIWHLGVLNSRSLSPRKWEKFER